MKKLLVPIIILIFVAVVGFFIYNKYTTKAAPTIGTQTKQSVTPLASLKKTSPKLSDAQLDTHLKAFQTCFSRIGNFSYDSVSQIDDGIVLHNVRYQSKKTTTLGGIVSGTGTIKTMTVKDPQWENLTKICSTTQKPTEVLVLASRILETDTAATMNASKGSKALKITFKMKAVDITKPAFNGLALLGSNLAQKGSQAPDQAALANAVEAQSIQSYKATGISGYIGEGEDKVTFSADSLDMKDLDEKNINAFTLQNLTFTKNSNYKGLIKTTIKTTSLKNSMSNPRALLSLLKNPGNLLKKRLMSFDELSFQGLTTTQKGALVLSIKNLGLYNFKTQENSVMPQSLNLKLDDAQFTIRTDPDTVAMLGQSTLTTNARFNLNLDPKTQLLTIKDSFIDVKDFGRLDLNLTLSNIDSNQMSLSDITSDLFMKGALNNMTFKITKRRLLDNIVAYNAKQKGKTRQEFLQSIANDFSNMNKGLNNSQKGKVVLDNVQAFILGKPILTITAQPAKPVSFAIISAAAIVPQKLIEILNVVMTASD